MKVRIRKMDLHKAMDRSGLVLVEVPINTKNGVIRGKRWKRPNAALDKFKDSLKTDKISSKTTLTFTDKKGNKKSEKEFLKDYEKNGNERTLQDFLKQEYKSAKPIKQKEVVDNSLKMDDKSGKKPFIRETMDELLKTNEFEERDGKLYLKEEFNDLKNREFWQQYINIDLEGKKLEKNLKRRVEKYSGKMLKDAKFNLASLEAAIEGREYILNNLDDYGEFYKKHLKKYLKSVNELLYREDEKAKKSKKIMASEKGITKDKEFIATNNYDKVKNEKQYLKSLSKIKDYKLTDFAVASMDMLGINAPFFLGKSVCVHGACIVETMFDYSHVSAVVLNSKERNVLMQKKTVVHECMHGAILNNEIMTHDLNEISAETAAIYAMQQLEGDKGGKMIPGYHELLINGLPVIKKMEDFRDCKTIADVGKVFMEASITKDHERAKKWNDEYRDFIRDFDIESNNYKQYWEKYLPTGNKEVLSKKLDSYKDIVQERIDNTYDVNIPRDRVEKSRYEQGMATLISALKSGSITISQAMEAGSSAAFVLLACILDEEGIEEFDVFMG